MVVHGESRRPGDIGMVEAVKGLRKPLALTIEEQSRFWSLVDRSPGPSACWPWRGWRVGPPPNHYGRVWLQGGRHLAHRVAYVLETHASLEPETCVLHRCDNPECVNPSHLMAGTQRDNIADMNAKGRGYRPQKKPKRARGVSNGDKTHCLRGHAYDAENTYVFRGAGRNCRLCRKCQALGARARRAKGREC